MNIFNDTIAAIATPPGISALGVIRISGDNSLEIFKKLFKPSKNIKSHYMYYGNIIFNNEIIDEVMACCMLKPNSYTAEDSVEIYAHGGTATLYGILDAILQTGARIALPGEFTKRAFLNGRLNLTQAEAVMDLIASTNEISRRTSLNQLKNSLAKKISDIRDVLLEQIANIELSIDYPEHEEEAKNREAILESSTSILDTMESLYKTYDYGRIIKEGIKTAIIGLPNVGKSTLINAILDKDRAIVHETPGTTRDIVSEHVQIGEFSFVLMDTAGLRETDNPVESIGVEKSKQAAEEADLILYIISLTDSENEEDIISKLQHKPMIIIYNKVDARCTSRSCGLCNGVKANCVINKIETPIYISAKNRQGLESLYDAMEKQAKEISGIANINKELEIITNKRHKQLLGIAIEHVKKAVHDFKSYIPEDLVSIDLMSAYTALGEILGEEVKDDLIDMIFSRFCVGK